MQYSIAVCDDVREDRAYLTGLIRAWAEAAGHIVRITEFSSSENFLFHYAEKKDYDILFLDIEMGSMDGVTLAKKLRTENPAIQIVFVTGFPDYIAEGYEVSALHYLMKPAAAHKVTAVLDRAAAVVERSEKAVLLPIAGETFRINISDIQYAEAFSHFAAIVTTAETIQVKIPISELENLLGRGFIRCHRSYLVGLKHIARLSKAEVILDSGKALPLSRSAAAQVHRAFISYYTGEEDETV